MCDPHRELDLHVLGYVKEHSVRPQGGVERLKLSLFGWHGFSGEVLFEDGRVVVDGVSQ